MLFALLVWFAGAVEVSLPLTAPVLLLSDWLPVDVVLSMFTVERPRASMVGLTVEVEPLVLLVLFAVERVLEAVFAVFDVVFDAVEGLRAAEVDVEAEGAMLADVFAFAVASGMQSSWTALAEFCLALPVDLSASLPALGWARPDLPASRLLHGGSVALAVVVAFADDCFEVAELVFANAGAAIMAATASALMNWERIICFLLVGKKGPRKKVGHENPAAGSAAASPPP